MTVFPLFNTKSWDKSVKPHNVHLSASSFSIVAVCKRFENLKFGETDYAEESSVTNGRTKKIDRILVSKETLQEFTKQTEKKNKF